MKFYLSTIISILLLLSSPLFGQSERPETIIIPVSGIGEIPNSRKLILQNKLTNKLKQYFRIVPQEKYEQVLEQVFAELEYEECKIWNYYLHRFGQQGCEKIWERDTILLSG